MFSELIALGILGSEYVYHRWIEDHPAPKNPGQTITLPTSSPASVIPLLYGKIRVRAPILAWWGAPSVQAGSTVGSDATYVYFVDMFFLLGIGFQSGIARVKNMWAGERLMGGGPFALTGNGNHEVSGYTDSSALPGDAGFVGGGLEVLNGYPTQVLVDPSDLSSKTWTADRMIIQGIPPQQIPGYRNFLSILLGGDAVPWCIGSKPQPDAYSFEVTAYPDGGNPLIGDDVNPIDVIYDILTGWFAKLGLDASRVDTETFTAAAEALDTEQHGFSRSWDESRTAGELIDEILIQIDGVMFEDPTDELIKVKLIRPDYDPTALSVIDPSNCSAITNFATGGWTDVPNKVTVQFTERANNYLPGTASAINQANAVAQDGEVQEVILQMPGITTQATADEVAGRELAARSRPLFKCRAMVTRDFDRKNIGDVVKLNWPEANISGMICRVAAVSRGTLQDGTIALDLLQDYFYQWRRRPPAGLPGLAVDFPVAVFRL